MLASKRDWLLAPHQSDKLWFVNLCRRCPDLGSLTDRQTLAVLRRSNLDIFWIRNTSTIHGILGYAKELVRRYSEAGRPVPLIAITAWLVSDEVGMVVVIHIVEK